MALPRIDHRGNVRSVIEQRQAVSHASMQYPNRWPLATMSLEMQSTKLASRARKIRCDEQKPHCNRCVSTGRKCDGYADDKDVKIPPSSARESLDSALSLWQAPQQVHRIPRNVVPLPRNNRREIRSYRFFLEVTAPAIAGVFDVDFWLTNIPRTCHLDPAIWHAVVGLGAVHENYVANLQGISSDEATREFILQQTNAAIGHLIRRSSTRTVLDQKWRALIASILFTYQCSIQGHYSQATVHSKAARNLIEELNKSGPCQVASRKPEPSNSNAYSLQTVTRSVPNESLLSIVATLEVQCEALQTPDITRASPLLGSVDSYTAWRYYSAPARASSLDPCRHGKCEPTRATPANITQAGKAFKSLLNALILLSQVHAAEIARLILAGEHNLFAFLVRQQEPYARIYRELGIAIGMFVADTSSECSCFRTDHQASASKGHQRKAIGVLRLYHAICYPLFVDKSMIDNQPVEMYHPLILKTPDMLIGGSESQGSIRNAEQATGEALASHFASTLSLAESVLQYEPTRPFPTEASELTPVLPTVMPLFIMANTSGIPFELRLQAIDLLRRYPQHEVLWDSTFAAALGEFVIRQQMNSAIPSNPLENRVHGAAVTFTETGTARVVIQLWEEWIANTPGREEVIVW